MTTQNPGSKQPLTSSDTLLQQTASDLHALVAELASRLQPFPSFLNMVSLQAIEIDPLPAIDHDLGCVVVLPGGEICELDLKVVPGIEGLADLDSVEELKELELAPEDYITFAAIAIRLLHQELRRRGQ